MSDYEYSLMRRRNYTLDINYDHEGREGPNLVEEGEWGGEGLIEGVVAREIAWCGSECR